MVKKIFINANDFLLDSFKLGRMILKYGLKPDFIVALWRGGTPVGIAVQELLEYHGIKSDHIAIRTSAYDGIDSMHRQIKVHGLSYIVERANSDDTVLFVDDVFDTGLSMKAVIDKLKSKSRKNMPNIKIATVYYKPSRSKVDFKPDFYVHSVDDWLIFPHELIGLSEDEVNEKNSGLLDVVK